VTHAQAFFSSVDHTNKLIYYMAGSVSGQETEYCDVIDYPKGMTRCVPQESSVPFPYNKSFIDQALLDNMAGD